MDSGHHDNRRLYSLGEAAKLLGGLSVWTLRKHCGRNITVTRIGRRVFLRSEEVERIRREGLPSLRVGAQQDADCNTNSTAVSGQKENNYVLER